MNNHRRVNTPWPRSAKVIEFGPRDGAMGAALVADGFRYLAVVADSRQAQRVAAENPTLERQVAISRAANRIRQNNADVLILHGGLTACLRNFRDIRHASYVACAPQSGPMLVWTLLFWCGQFLLGRLASPRIARIGNERLLSFRVRRPRPYTSTRRFIPHWLGVEGFFGGLRSASVRHAVLRWFEQLPHVAPGEDLDLLVDDASLESVRRLLDSSPGLQAVDLYSVCGAPGADYRKLPYYPPYIAEQLLERAATHRDLCSVPAPRDHFRSLAYHAVYHKGFASGLAADGNSRPKAKRPEHDYPRILANMAQRLAIDVPITIAGLDAWLDAQGWRPPHDMLIRLTRKNRALRPLIAEVSAKSDDAGLAVFLVRREALSRGGVKRAAKLLTEQGFSIVETITFAPDRVESIARTLRGGNWGRGPWPTSGGEPVAAIVVHDPAPIHPSRQERRKYPFLANARLLKKDAIRDAFNANRPSHEHCNAIHSSDNAREARDYLRIIAPERVGEILERATMRGENRRRAA